MNDFTASNKVTVAHLPNADVWTVDPAALKGPFSRLNTDQMQALREFFLAEADERMGRWRSKVDPDWTAVPDPGPQVISFRHDDGLRAFDVDPDGSGLARWDPELQAVAREYLDAHQEPKPWHEAAEDEIWSLTVNGREAAWVRRADVWERVTDAVLLRNAPASAGISAGHRIWPEVSHD